MEAISRPTQEDSKYEEQGQLEEKNRSVSGLARTTILNHFPSSSNWLSHGNSPPRKPTLKKKKKAPPKNGVIVSIMEAKMMLYVPHLTSKH